MTVTVDSRYEYIDFPVNIVSFIGYRPTENPMITKIPSKIRKSDLEDGVTIFARHIPSSDFQIAFDVYFTKREQYTNQYTGKLGLCLTERLILRIYWNKDRWSITFNGHFAAERMDKLNKVISFCMDYAENFKQ